MTTQFSSSKQTILISKPHRLFSERRVFSLARAKLLPTTFKLWLDHALRIQNAIYVIDEYYEQFHEIERDVTAHMWKDIETAIECGGEFPNDNVYESLSKLRDYESVEARIHQSSRIVVTEYMSVLRTKISDVSLVRNLIWIYSKFAPQPSELRFWNAFDMCAELIEDFRDLKEDTSDWNFNFWLNSARSNKARNADIHFTIDILSKLMGRLEYEYAKLPCNESKLQRPLLHKIISEARSITSGKSLETILHFESRAIPYASLANCDKSKLAS